MAAEVRLDLVLAQVDRRGDDVARGLAADLEKVFAEIAFEDLDADIFEVAVEADLLGDHRFALGDQARAALAAEAGDDSACLGAVGCPVHAAAGGLGLCGEGFEIDVEVRDRVVADVASFVAQRLELRHARHGGSALGDEPAGQTGERAREILVGDGGGGVLLEAFGGGRHAG